jgi:hypothetical protein
MAAIDDLTVDWTDDSGKQTTKQLEKVILSKGAWATLMFLYQDLDPKTGEFGATKVRIQRYKKRGDIYLPQSKFNISSAKQAKAIRDALGQWFSADSNDAGGDDEE